MSLQDNNFYAIIATAILQFIIGGLWYSPCMFGNTWLKACHLKSEELKGDAGSMIGEFICTLVISCILSLFVHATHAVTSFEGAMIGFWAWLGFVATTHFTYVLWERKPLKVYFIKIACLLLTFVLTGAILAYWR